MSYGKRLKLVRGDMLQEDFAKILDVHKNTLVRFESEKGKPDIEHLKRILEAFPKINPTWLLTGEGEMRRVEAVKHLTEEDLAFGKALCEIGTVGKQYACEAVPGWTPNADHPASKSTPSDGPGGYSDYELRFVLLRDVIETYESMRPGREPDRKAREITIIYRHFIEHCERGLDEVEISEYIDRWL